MKFRTSTKIIFFILAAMIILAVIAIIVEYPKLKNSPAAVSHPVGTCAPDALACAGNPKLCLDENKNLVCN